ncbi:MAG: hypothetical protein II593_00385, partial [Prevotella sp.]|nr:hypothetical protein [Prevotella sp.]
MKRKIQIILAACMAVMLMTACGEDDETLGTEYQDPTNNFIPNPSANDDTSVLRREFKEKYGSYLLFTDTLQHYQIGIDVNGDPKYFTELLNILYAVGQSLPLTDTQKYTYFTDIEEQRKVVDYMDQYILNHITGKLRPFSWFLAKTIEVTDNQRRVTRPFAACGQRTIVVSLGQALRLSESGKKTLATRILNTIIGQLAQNNSSAFTDFFAISGVQYSRSMSVPEGTTREKYLFDNGFISPSTSNANLYFPSQKDDLQAYSLVVISYTDERIENTYGQYP